MEMVSVAARSQNSSMQLAYDNDQLVWRKGPSYLLLIKTIDSYH